MQPMNSLIFALFCLAVLCFSALAHPITVSAYDRYPQLVSDIPIPKVFGNVNMNANIVKRVHHLALLRMGKLFKNVPAPHADQIKRDRNDPFVRYGLYNLRH